MTSIALTVAFYVGCFMVGWFVPEILERKWPCTCGRTRTPYYFHKHERAGAMWFWPILFAPLVVINFVTLDYLGAIVISLVETFYVRRWWLHEKDKMKRKAAKLAGHVALNKHGRLVVES